MDSSNKKRKLGDIEAAADAAPRHLTSIRTVSNGFVLQMLSAAQRMKTLVETAGGDNRLARKVLACIFYEPSTRTNCSFQAAMLRLGGKVIAVNEQHSSVKKGESLSDTIRTMAAYCDGVVIRHPDKGSSEVAAAASDVPVINAGDGVGEHPTQALLDLFTIQSELHFLNESGSIARDIKVVFVGDLKHGRTVHSLALLLAAFPSGVELQYVSPDGLGMPDAIQATLREAGVRQTKVTLEEAMPSADVVYVTRCQRERFETPEDYERVANMYVVNKESLETAKADMIVMHPLPRVHELSEDVDCDPRAAYFRQVRNGMYMRMALLDYFLNLDESDGDIAK